MRQSKITDVVITGVNIKQGQPAPSVSVQYSLVDGNGLVYGHGAATSGWSKELYEQLDVVMGQLTTTLQRHLFENTVGDIYENEETPKGLFPNYEPDSI